MFLVCAAYALKNYSGVELGDAPSDEEKRRAILKIMRTRLNNEAGAANKIRLAAATAADANAAGGRAAASNERAAEQGEN